MSHAGMKNDGSYTPDAFHTDFHVGIKIITYPAGEPQLTISKQRLRYIENTGVFDARGLGDKFGDVMLLAQASDIIKHAMPDKKVSLYLPYMPFSRQDRRVAENTASSLKVFAGMINSMFFSSVKTLDAHSDVSEAVFNRLDNSDNRAIVQEAVNIHGRDQVIFLSPDAGAAKKMPELIKLLDLADMEVDLQYAQKHRDVLTGEITHTSVPDGLDNSEVMIVDDICDGGRTFIEIAKALPSSTKKHLVVSHGIFSKGTDALFEHFDTVTTTDSFPQTDRRLGLINV